MYPVDLVKKLSNKRNHGIPDHGDVSYSQRSYEIWDIIAPNGAVVRTSILGIHEFGSLDKVIVNATNICGTTHVHLRYLYNYSIFCA